MSPKQPVMLTTAKPMFGVGVIGILGCVGFLMCSKYIFGPALRKKRLAESQEFAEILMQLELQQAQKKKEESENWGS